MSGLRSAASQPRREVRSQVFSLEESWTHSALGFDDVIERSGILFRAAAQSLARSVMASRDSLLSTRGSLSRKAQWQLFAGCRLARKLEDLQIDILPQPLGDFGAVPNFSILRTGDLILSRGRKPDFTERSISDAQRRGGFSDNHSCWTHAAVYGTLICGGCSGQGRAHS
jgi:hypothetical protein